MILDENPTTTVEDGLLIRTYRGMFHCRDKPAKEHPDGKEEWFLFGEPHREDGPAVGSPDGTRKWCRHGKLHREDGPAVASPDGLEWYRHGMLHREDGPAVINSYRKSEKSSFFRYNQLQESYDLY